MAYSGSARLEVIGWGGDQNVDGGGIGGGVAQGSWVFVVGVALGFIHVRMVRGMCRNGWSKSE